jgi:uncharacterized protein YggE
MRDDQQPFVEVLAEASYEEPIERFVAELQLEVRGASEDSAVQQVAELSRRCVERLTSGGLARDEIEDAGLSMHRPWWFRKKEQAGKTATHQLRVRCGDVARLNAALVAVDGVTANPRETVNLNMRQPIFREDDAARAEALRLAVRAGREKAQAVADEAGAALGRLLSVEEGPSAQRHSGYGGDSDWWGDSGRFAALRSAGGGMGMVEEAPEPLATPARTIWVRCRARFELKYA